MHSLELSPASRRHIEKLYEFYESQESGKGSTWMAAFIDELDRLEQNPRIGAYLTTRKEGIRYWISQDRFKTVVVYRIQENEVQVSGIYDSRSDWK